MYWKAISPNLWPHSMYRGPCIEERWQWHLGREVAAVRLPRPLGRRRRGERSCSCRCSGGGGAGLGRGAAKVRVARTGVRRLRLLMAGWRGGWHLFVPCAGGCRLGWRGCCCLGGGGGP